MLGQVRHGPRLILKDDMLSMFEFSSVTSSAQTTQGSWCKNGFQHFDSFETVTYIHDMGRLIYRNCSLLYRVLTAGERQRWALSQRGMREVRAGRTMDVLSQTERIQAVENKAILHLAQQLLV